MDDVRKGSFGAVCEQCGLYHAPDVGGGNCQPFAKFNVTKNHYWLISPYILCCFPT